MSGVSRLRAARALRAKDAQRDSPPATPRKPLKTSNKSPNTRLGALGDHEDLPKFSFDPSKPTHDPSAYAPCCDAGLHGGSVHAGPHTYEARARSKWIKEQERLARRG
jgi:hypothetical protein